MDAWKQNERKHDITRLSDQWWTQHEYWKWSLSCNTYLLFVSIR